MIVKLWWVITSWSWSYHNILKQMIVLSKYESTSARCAIFRIQSRVAVSMFCLIIYFLKRRGKWEYHHYCNMHKWPKTLLESGHRGLQDCIVYQCMLTRHWLRRGIQPPSIGLGGGGGVRASPTRERVISARQATRRSKALDETVLNRPINFPNEVRLRSGHRSNSMTFSLLAVEASKLAVLGQKFSPNIRKT